MKHSRLSDLFIGCLGTVVTYFFGKGLYQSLTLGEINMNNGNTLSQGQDPVSFYLVGAIYVIIVLAGLILALLSFKDALKKSDT